MKLLLVTLGIISVSFGTIIKHPMEHYQEGDRYFYFPGDGDNSLHLVDTLEPVDYVFLDEFRRSSANYPYWLFTRQNPSTPHVLDYGDKSSIFNSSFNKYNQVVFLVHGWYGHGDNMMNRILTDAFLHKHDVNVIVLDWSDLSTRNYITAKKGVAVLGEQLGQFIMWLNEEFGVSYNKIHLVGFSLGAHMVGNAGRTVGGLIRRITGLDPAGPLWKNDQNRLRSSDAQYVEVIHTNTALYGFSDPCGDADFYPNGGSLMPGCWFNVCSHSKGYEYMAASIVHNHLLAQECSNIRDASYDKCSGSVYPMGNSDLSKSRSGIFRVNTGTEFPF
ncbi:unnamed protein product [Colias eurytheme]|nr:unnamed protein product [Colias eurytheme]